jgi:hypothetical protein
MPLRISKKSSEGRWEKFGGDIEFKIRPLTAEIMKRLTESARTGRMVLEPKSGRMIPEIDNEKLEELVRDHLIEDWRGVEDDADPPASLPCTSETKKAVLDNLSVQDFVFERARSADILPERSKN